MAARRRFVPAAMRNVVLCGPSQAHVEVSARIPKSALGKARQQSVDCYARVLYSSFATKWSPRPNTHDAQRG